MCARTVQIAAMQTAPRQPKVVLTVGHSTRAQDDFIALLRTHGVKRLVDIRTIPRSRHNPQFNRDHIGAALRRAGITYLHMKALGGLRHARPDSLNTAWRNASFRGFADYMQTREFARGLRRLMGMARTKQTAIMCAEAVPWRCHRSLIADALLAHGYRVDEIESLKRTRPHVLTPWARLWGSKISYPSAEVAAGEQAERKGDTPTMIKLKPAYEPGVASDGARYLVERLWSRGMKKTALRIDAWLRDVAPSTALRQWFNHDPKKWEQFQRRYSRELDASPDAVRSLLTAAQRGTVTLVYSSHDSLHNNAVALKKYLEQKLAKSAGPSRKSAA